MRYLLLGGEREFGGLRDDATDADDREDADKHVDNVGGRGAGVDRCAGQGSVGRHGAAYRKHCGQADEGDRPRVQPSRLNVGYAVAVHHVRIDEGEAAQPLSLVHGWSHLPVRSACCTACFTSSRRLRDRWAQSMLTSALHGEIRAHAGRESCDLKDAAVAPHPFDQVMLEAFLWGAVAASPLLVGALIAYAATPSKSLIAVVMALGAGLLIGSVAFELIDEALKTADVAKVGLFTLVGAATFTIGDRIIDKQGGGDRKDADGGQASGSPLAIVFGSVLDGIPESFVLGLTVLQGGVSVPLLIGVLLSNLPEGLSSFSGLRIAGWARTRVVRMWLLVILVAAVSAAAGYAVLDPASGHTGALPRASPRARCSR